MKCISPLTIKQKDGRRDTVPCGCCGFCLAKKRADWSFRLGIELKESETAWFVTMTYDEINVVLHETSKKPTLSKRDLQLFFKKVRKKNEKKVRYYAVGEYGTRTHRPHYHALIFNLDSKTTAKIGDIWSKGNVKIGTVTPASIHYVTKYVINRTEDYPEVEKPFALMSRRPGIGASYKTSHERWHKENKANWTKINGIPAGLPRFYRESFFNKRERTKMAEAAIIQSDIDFYEEIERLSKLCDDPYLNMQERERYANDTVVSKANKLNTF